MVKKLFKYEVKSYLRVIIPTLIILFSIAVTGRIMQLFESDNVFYFIIYGSCVLALYVGSIASLFAVMVFAVIRYYKNFFTQEGYLTFTLPINADQHIFVKLATAVMFSVIMFLSVIVAVTVFIPWDLLVALLDAAAYLLKIAFSGKVAAHFVFYVIEALVYLFTTTVVSLLIYYSCISIGQRSNKNRILMAILTYVIYYLVAQTISTVVWVLISVFSAAGLFDGIALFMTNHPYATVHIFLIGATVLYSIFGAGLYFISSYTIKRKLNLE